MAVLARPSSRTRFALRIVRNVAIAVALIAMVPVGIVGLRSDTVWQRHAWARSVNVANAERVRPFRIAADPSITPARAGVAFNSLMPPPNVENAAFQPIEAHRSSRPWDSLAVAPGMFTSLTADFYKGLRIDVISAVPKGFSAEEMAYLRSVATAPIWKDFDIVARAPAVDLVGGQLHVPFASGASWFRMPAADFGATRAIGHAAATRAAWLMARGQIDSAEAVLKGIVSFGFALIDNSTSVADEMNGSVIVAAGRESLRQFYVVTKNPLASSEALAPVRRVRGDDGQQPMKQWTREELLGRVRDPHARRGDRYEALRLLSLTSCTNVKELLLGPGEDVRRVMDEARRSLGRYPSEQAVADVVSRLPSFRSSDIASPVAQLVTSASAVAGAALHNDRMATCSLVAGGF